MCSELIVLKNFNVEQNKPLLRELLPIWAQFTTSPGPGHKSRLPNVQYYNSQWSKNS